MCLASYWAIALGRAYGLPRLAHAVIIRNAGHSRKSFERAGEMALLCEAGLGGGDVLMHPPIGKDKELRRAR